MNRLVNFVKAAVANALRLMCLLAGTWLAGVAPVAHFADKQREMNAIFGRIPNMDPGVGVSIAVVLVIPVLVLLVVIESCRVWIWDKKPLALPSLFALGLVAAWPFGVAFSGGLLDGKGGMGVLVVSLLSVAALYAVRHWWMSKRS